MAVRKTRGKGEGSIYKLPNGKWVVQVECGRYPNGRRRLARRQVATKADAPAVLRELQQMVELGVTPDQTRTVEVYLSWWLDNVAAGQVKASTLEDYRGIVDRYIVPSIGAHKLLRLTPVHVQAMLTKLEQDGYAPNTRRYALAVLRRSLGWATRTGMVARNVATLAEGPKVGRSANLDRALSVAEARAVLDAARSDRLYAFAVVVLNLGLRRGEALALRWSNVDFDAKTITVAGTLKAKRGGGTYIDSPKTSGSARTIPMVPAVEAALREHRDLQADERRYAGPLWRESGHVFVAEDGRPVLPNFATRWWPELTERAGLGRRRLHDTRHTAATLMLAQGVPLETVSALLGHGNLAITSDIYAHVGQDAKRRALTGLGVDLFGGGRSGGVVVEDAPAAAPAVLGVDAAAY